MSMSVMNGPEVGLKRSHRELLRALAKSVMNGPEVGLKPFLAIHRVDHVVRVGDEWPRGGIETFLEDLGLGRDQHVSVMNGPEVGLKLRVP